GGERVAVGRGFRDQVEAEHAARPRPVLHYDLLAEPLGQLRTDQPRHDVGGVARRERNDDLDGLDGIGLPVSERSNPERERGEQPFHRWLTGMMGRRTKGFCSKCSVTRPPKICGGLSVGSSCTNGPQPFIGFFMLESVAASPSYS